MENFEIGQRLVFCPNHNDYVSHKGSRGADGIIISTQKKSKRDKTKKLYSFLLKWRWLRKGVACFRIKGKRQARSDWSTELQQRREFSFPMMSRYSTDDTLRFEETFASLHPLSYCNDCPLRLNRLVAPCKIDRQQAINRMKRREAKAVKS